MTCEITISGRDAERLLGILDRFRAADARCAAAGCDSDDGEARVASALYLASYLSYVLAGMHAEEVG